MSEDTSMNVVRDRLMAKAEQVDATRQLQTKILAAKGSMWHMVSVLVMVAGIGLLLPICIVCVKLVQFLMHWQPW